LQDKDLRNRPTPRGAESGALSDDSTHDAQGLQGVIDSWASLPDAVREQIAALMKTTLDADASGR